MRTMLRGVAVIVLCSMSTALAQESEYPVLSVVNERLPQWMSQQISAQIGAIRTEGELEELLSREGWQLRERPNHYVHAAYYRALILHFYDKYDAEILGIRILGGSAGMTQADVERHDALRNRSTHWAQMGAAIFFKNKALIEQAQAKCRDLQCNGRLNDRINRTVKRHDHLRILMETDTAPPEAFLSPGFNVDGWTFDINPERVPGVFETPKFLAVAEELRPYFGVLKNDHGQTPYQAPATTLTTSEEVKAIYDELTRSPWFDYYPHLDFQVKASQGQFNETILYLPKTFDALRRELDKPGITPEEARAIIDRYQPRIDHQSRPFQEGLPVLLATQFRTAKLIAHSRSQADAAEALVIYTDVLKLTGETLLSHAQSQVSYQTILGNVPTNSERPQSAQ
jgi:hypothetical protein